MTAVVNKESQGLICGVNWIEILELVDLNSSSKRKEKASSLQGKEPRRPRKDRKHNFGECQQLLKEEAVISRRKGQLISMKAGFSSLLHAF